MIQVDNDAGTLILTSENPQTSQHVGIGWKETRLAYVVSYMNDFAVFRCVFDGRIGLSLRVAPAYTERDTFDWQTTMAVSLEAYRETGVT